MTQIQNLTVSQGAYKVILGSIWHPAQGWLGEWGEAVAQRKPGWIPFHKFYGMGWWLPNRME